MSFSQRRAGAFHHRLRAFHEPVRAAGAHHFQRGLLGGEVIVEAGLAHAEHVGDRLRRGAVIAALGEHAGRRIDDLVGTAQHAAVADETCAGRVRGHGLTRWCLTR